MAEEPSELPKAFAFFVCEENYLVKYFMQTNQAYKAINGSIFVQGKFKQLFSVKETSGWMAGRVSSIFTTKMLRRNKANKEASSPF